MPHEERIVSISPTSHGFGFAVFEDTTLIDWGHAHLRPAKTDRCLARAMELLSWYDPSIVVIEDVERASSRRGERVKNLLKQIARLVRNSSTQLVKIPRGLVSRVFSVSGNATKHEIATTVLIHYPELEAKLPPPRRVWTSEDERMAIFDAVALTLVFKHGPINKSDVT